jgi:hypothetical protein
VKILNFIKSKLQTFQNLTTIEKKLLIQALFLFPIVTISLTLSNFQTTYAILKKITNPHPKTTIDEEKPIRTVVKSVKIAAKYHNYAVCLPKSLVLWYLLKNQGVNPQLQIGTRFHAGKLEFHAWVEYQDRVLGDYNFIKNRFVAFKQLTEKMERRIG